MATDLSEEEVFSNDVDPLDAIREIRKAEGVKEEDLIPADPDKITQKDPIEEDGKDELDALETTGKSDTKDPDIKEDIADEPKDKSDEDTQSTDNLDDDNKDNDEKDTEKDTESSDDPVAKDVDKDEDEKLDKGIKKFTANGQEFEFTQEERDEQFEIIFGQAMDYTQKTQKMAPYRKMISALESENITADQLNMAIDALRGNKQALNEIVKLNKLDVYDLDNDEDKKDSYIPTEYGKNDIQLGIDEVTSKISNDPEYQITVDIIDKQWDASSRDTLSNNPNMIAGLHNDIKSGVYDKVSPEAMKMKVLDGNRKSDIEYYMLAGEKVLSVDKQNSVKAEQTVADSNKNTQDAENKFDRESSEAQRKRSASPTRKRSDGKTVTDYLADDDTEYDAWYKNLTSSI